MPQPHQKRRPQNQRQARPNKAKQREAQVRAEQMAAEPTADLLAADDDPGLGDVVGGEPVALTPDVIAPATTSASSIQKKRRDTRGGSRRAPVAPAQVGITRAQEYEFIRADLRRLLSTAGVVLVLMLGLLFVIEG